MNTASPRPTSTGQEPWGLLLLIGCAAWFSVTVHLAGPLACWLSGTGWATPRSGWIATTLTVILHGWADAFTPAPSTVLAWVLAIVFTFIPVGVVGLLLVRQWRHRDDHTGARWASSAQERGLRVPAQSLKRPRRLVLGFSQRTGALLAAPAGMSACVFGPPGSMKTFGLVLPNALEWDGPLVVSTAKAPDVTALINLCRRQNRPFWVLAPAAHTTINSERDWTPACWSPVDYADTPERAGRMAKWLTESSGAEGGKDGRPWVVQATKYLKGLLLAAHCATRDSTANISSIGLFTQWLYEGEAAKDTVRTNLLGHGHTDVAREYASTWALHDNGKGSVLFTAFTLAAAYDQPAVRASAARTDVTAVDLLDRRGVLILVAKPTEADELAPVFTAMIASILHEAETRYETTGKPLDPGLGLLLDEAGNVFRYPRLAELCTTARGIGITLLTVWHDLAQLSTRFGEEVARTVVNACKVRILLGGSGDETTLRYFSGLAGRALIDRTSSTHSTQGGYSTSVGAHSDDLAPVHLLRQLPPGTGFAQCDTLPPMRIRLRTLFTDKTLQRLAAVPIAAVSATAPPAEVTDDPQ